MNSKEGTMLDKLIDRIGDVQSRATVRTVFGDPIEVHGRTIIPVRKSASGSAWEWVVANARTTRSMTTTTTAPQAVAVAAPSSGPSP